MCIGKGLEKLGRNFSKKRRTGKLNWRQIEKEGALAF